MTKSQLKQIIKEVIQEKNINEFNFLGSDVQLVMSVSDLVGAALLGVVSLVLGAAIVKEKFGQVASSIIDEYQSQKEARKVALLDKELQNTIKPILSKFKDDEVLADMYKSLPPYTDTPRSPTGNIRKRGLVQISKYIKSKLNPEEEKFLNIISVSIRKNYKK